MSNQVFRKKRIFSQWRRKKRGFSETRLQVIKGPFLARLGSMDGKRRAGVRCDGRGRRLATGAAASGGRYLIGGMALCLW